MSKPTIVTCAVTGGGDTAGLNPAVPVLPEQIAQSAIDAGDAGAAIVHIHVRDPETRCGSMDPALYADVFARVRAARPELIINLTTGAGALMTAAQARDPAVGPTMLATPERRVAHIRELRPDICSLDIATMNFGDRLFLNSVADITEMAEVIQATGVKPELEAFDTGHMRLINHLIGRSVLPADSMVQICLGVMGGAPADSEAMIGMVRMLPPGVIWSGFGIGAQQFPMVAQAVMLGGHVRVGLEDNLYIERGVLAESNAALVDKCVRLLALLGHRPATPAETREILGL